MFGSTTTTTQSSLFGGGGGFGATSTSGGLFGTSGFGQPAASQVIYSISLSFFILFQYKPNPLFDNEAI